MPELPDTDSLRCFEAAARYLHFRTAAETVSLSPSAFSARIRALEDLVGEPLFERTTRHVALTAAGLRLLPQARRALEEAARCVSCVHEEEGAVPFAVTVGTRFELGMSFLVPELGTLAARRPDRTVHLYFGDSQDLVQRLRTGHLDAIVTSARLTQAELRYARLHEERYAFVAAPALLERAPLASPEDAARHVLLDAHGDLPLFRYFLDAAPPEQVWAFRAKEYLGTIAAVRYRTLEGAGVAVLPLYFVRAELDAGALVRVVPEVEPQRDLFRFVLRAGHPFEDELLTLAEELRAVPLR